MKSNWHSHSQVPSRSYTCGHCGNPLASNQGYFADLDGSQQRRDYIYICHFCGKPTYFNIDGTQTPKAKVGNEVKGINDESVLKLYDEVRKSAGVDAPTVTVMGCRIILMHVAVAKGAKENQSFEFYVDFLDKKGYIPTGLKKWAEVIRKMGNKANHKITIVTDEQAKNILSFTEVLLKIIYEMPAEIERSASPEVKSQ